MTLAYVIGVTANTKEEEEKKITEYYGFERQKQQPQDYSKFKKKRKKKC